MQRTDRNLLLAIVGLLIIGLFSALGVMELRGEEPRRALVALEMVFSGEYIRPTVHGWNYYNKPPVFNWLIVAGFHLFGSFANWVVRVPSIVAFLLTGLVNYWFVRRWINERVALLSSLFYLTTAHLLLFATVLSGEMDLLYTLVVYLQAMVLFMGFQNQRYLGMFLGSYVLMALGFLLKGLPSLPFQGLTLLALIAWHQRWRLLVDWRHFAGLTVGGVIIFSYFWAYSFQADPWPFFFNLIEEASKKSASESRLLKIAVHLFEFPLQLFADLLPWSLLGYFLIRQQAWRHLRENPLVSFSVLFVLANIWLYWISPGTKSRYHYMFFPFILIVLAWATDRFSRLQLRTLLWVGLILAAGRVIYNFTLLPYQVKTMEASVRYRNIAAETLSLTEGRPVHWAGGIDCIDIDPSLGPVTLLQSEIWVPPHIPYQIPFYIARGNGYLFQYDEEPKSGVFYLAEERFARTHQAEILRTFPGWEGQNVVLCRFSSKQ